MLHFPISDLFLERDCFASNLSYSAIASAYSIMPRERACWTASMTDGIRATTFRNGTVVIDSNRGQLHCAPNATGRNGRQLQVDSGLSSLSCGEYLPAPATQTRRRHGSRACLRRSAPRPKFCLAQRSPDRETQA